jgi:hypothetical protein
VDTDVEIQTVTTSASPSTVTVKNCFRHPEAHPLILDMVLLRRYGPEFLGWQAETLEHVIPQDFGTSLSHVNQSKIQACRTLHLVDSFWQQWEVFSWLTMALNGVPPDFEIMQVPTVAQAAVAIDIAARIRTDVPWSSEVKTFLQSVMDHDGVHVAVAPFDIIQPSPLDTVNTAEILTRWPDVRATNRIPTDETVEGEQLRRLLTVYDYVRDYQNRLRAQLEILRHV